MQWDRQNQDRERQEKPRSHEEIMEPAQNPAPGLIHKIQIPYVLDLCLKLLGGLRQKIESGGFNKKRDATALEKIYGPDTDLHKTPLRSYLAWVNTAKAPQEERVRKGYATPEQCKNNVITEIDREIDRFRKYGQDQKFMESKRTKLEILRRSVPDSPALDRLSRYETTLERAFDRTLNQLERIQRLRRGQPVAPRIDTTVSSEPR